MSFKILSIDEKNKTMVIDWLDGQVYNHAIPEELLGNSVDETTAAAIIEQQRPPALSQEPVSDGVLSLFGKHNPPPTFEQLKEQKTALIDRWRIIAEQKGLLYTFPSGEQDVIQLRDERDVANVIGQVSAALILQAQNVTDPVLPFRAESNTTYMLTPIQTLEMGMAVNQFMGQNYQIAWALKEQVASAQTEADLDAIGWPV